MHFSSPDETWKKKKTLISYRVSPLSVDFEAAAFAIMLLFLYLCSRIDNLYIINLHILCAQC
ncbi:hypothetical protein SLEP1_g29431 [Rubroshorea leprosula]|uniref:Uncharacterized protein n=1 Tax=Rubroshorea leprosula TaxID=152421 RepID=A0AAV5K304_9ROSI|nr:hypothetical protein SLEP1_g29431 [Rubroshorea leprosula]